METYWWQRVELWYGKNSEDKNKKDNPHPRIQIFF
jgi:hypothetical protein